MEPTFVAAGVVAAGAEKSNRSADALGAGCNAGEDENTSPKPPKPPVLAAGVGFGAGGGFGAGSKNDPPPSAGAACDVVFAADAPFGAPNPPVSDANGDEKDVSWAGAEGATLSELKASFRSPKADCGTPDCSPPRPPAGCAGCGAGCGAGFGADAYNDRMDCLRSDFDGPLAAPLAVPRSLEGRAGAAGGAPKKSRPSRDSVGLVCFGGAG